MWNHKKILFQIRITEWPGVTSQETTSGLSRVKLLYMTSKMFCQSVTNVLFIFSDFGISEEAIRRYLIRKPMTTTELLRKFQKTRTNLSSDQLVNVLTQMLRRINPTKRIIKDKMYLSLAK